jgi:hypothetical protein
LDELGIVAFGDHQPVVHGGVALGHAVELKDHRDAIADLEIDVARSYRLGLRVVGPPDQDAWLPESVEHPVIGLFAQRLFQEPVPTQRDDHQPGETGQQTMEPRQTLDVSVDLVDLRGKPTLSRSIEAASSLSKTRAISSTRPTSSLRCRPLLANDLLTQLVEDLVKVVGERRIVKLVLTGVFPVLLRQELQLIQLRIGHLRARARRRIFSDGEFFRVQLRLDATRELSR